MVDILLDASVLVAYFNTRDVFHKRAFELMEKTEDDNLYLLEHVFDEVLGVLLRKLGPKDSVKAGKYMRKMARLGFTSSKEAEKAFKIFGEYPGLSYTDAHLVNIARLGPAIATFDKDIAGTGVDIVG